jgi:hypothetical protein
MFTIAPDRGHNQLMCAAQRHEDGVVAARLVALLIAFEPGDDAIGVSD